MSNKKTIIFCSLIALSAIITIGTIAYFRRTVNGNITGNTGNLLLVVNEINSEATENFNISLNENNEYVLPGDKGKFDININSTGSTDNVTVTVTLSRTNLPNNLKFYLDKYYKNEFTEKTFVIHKDDTMEVNFPVYWYWDGGLDNENDSLFMNTVGSASVSVVGTITSDKKLYDVMFENATLDTNVNFLLPSSASNGLGLMIREGTQTNEYPIVYYRGDITNNNVVFADYCWVIVRTTETGGIKLLYNGKVNSDGSCNNYSGVGGADVTFAADGSIGKYYYNLKSDSPVYAGYMYNDDNKYFTVLNDSGVFDIDGYKAHLNDNTIDSVTGRYNQNKYDSYAKKIIDLWYKRNLLGKIEESVIEDTVWCNDRSITSSIFLIDNYNYNAVPDMGIEKGFLYSPASRIFEASLTQSALSINFSCNSDIDKFTMNETNGNGDLDYPIGMITSDEAGAVGTYFLMSGTSSATSISLKDSKVLLLSPVGFLNDVSNVFGIYNGNYNMWSSDSRDTYIRPSISLVKGTQIFEGNGSFEQPYVVG